MSKKELVDTYQKLSGAELRQEEWECDIYSILYELIVHYNTELRYDPGVTFTAAKRRKLQLRDLLMEDIAYLAQYNPEINHIKRFCTG